MHRKYRQIKRTHKISNYIYINEKKVTLHCNKLHLTVFKIVNNLKQKISLSGYLILLDFGSVM